jgi:hypothetical protein
LFIKKWGSYGLDSCHSGYGPFVGYCERVNKFQVPWKMGNFLASFDTVTFRKQDSSVWIYVTVGWLFSQTMKADYLFYPNYAPLYYLTEYMSFTWLIA